MITRQRSASAAAAVAASSAASPSLPPLLSPPELGGSPRQLVDAFIRIGLLLSLDRPCPRCDDNLHFLVPHEDDRLRDRMRLRCNHCKSNWSVRHGSFLEIDELYLPALQPPLDIFGEQPPPVWVIGAIGRQTQWVALDIAPNHTSVTLRPLVEAHLPHDQTRTITDNDASSLFLRRRHPHYIAEKRKAGGALWVVAYQAFTPPWAPLTVHSNTIEGYWSQFRRRLHDSHGWSADYIPLVLAECMFRSLRTPLTAVLGPI